MKYGYDYESLNKLIDNYRVDNNKIIVTYLDGSREERILNRNEEKLLLNEMLRQAKIRNQSDMYSNLKQEKVMLTSWLVAITSNLLLDTKFLFNDSIGSVLKSILATLGCINSVCVVYGGIKYNLLNKKLDELEKYDIYLSIYEELEKCKYNIDIYNGVEYKKTLDINTIDNYTLDEIKLIENNLDKYTEKRKKLTLIKNDKIINLDKENRKLAL